MNLQDQQRLIVSLQDAGIYPHPVHHLRVIETHISWVVLTGPYAYKIKKSVDFGFLDFSTLSKRKHYCEEELRLNRRFSSTLYIDLITLTGTCKNPELNGSGPALEYAVRMLEFPSDSLFKDRLAVGQIHAGLIDALACKLAIFHQGLAATTAPVSATPPYGSIEAVGLPARENFQQIRPLLDQATALDQFRQLLAWVELALTSLTPIFQQRQTGGFIRECHGDLHLGNITVVGDEITFFDCLEFNDQLRWIDTFSELAFLIMDLQDHDCSNWSNRLLNRYLEQTGDYAGLQVLQFYQVYRAMVRAKVNYLRLHQAGLSALEITATRAIGNRYMALAQQFTVANKRFLAITHGISGSGKSHFSAALANEINAVHVRSDVERKRMFGLAAAARSDSEIDAGLYTAEITERTYKQLEAIACQVLNSAMPVIIDATFLEAGRRNQFSALARRLSVPFVILDCQAGAETITARLLKRNASATDASEAGIEVMRHQLVTQDPLTPGERSRVIAIDTEHPVEISQLLSVFPL